MAGVRRPSQKVGTLAVDARAGPYAGKTNSVSPRHLSRNCTGALRADRRAHGSATC